MSKDEFQRQYHGYVEHNRASAEEEARLVNDLADGFTVRVVEFPRLGCGLMLDSAVEALKGILPGDQ